MTTPNSELQELLDWTLKHSPDCGACIKQIDGELKVFVHEDLDL